MPVVTHKYTDIVLAVTAFSQGHVAAISAEIYTCGWKMTEESYNKISDGI